MFRKCAEQLLREQEVALNLDKLGSNLGDYLKADKMSLVVTTGLFILKYWILLLVQK